MNLFDWEKWQTVPRDDGPSELRDLDAGTTTYRFAAPWRSEVRVSMPFQVSRLNR